MDIGKKGEHLKALGFELVMDFLTVFILFMAYKYTYETLYSEELTRKLNFMRNAFIYLAPGSVEGFRIITSTSREEKNWDSIEFILSILSILIVFVLMIQYVCGNDEYATWYAILIMVYPIRIIASIGFEILNLVKERRR